jgi:hypothetical protein
MTDHADSTPTLSATPVRTGPPGIARSLVVDVAFPWLAVQFLERVWGVATVPAFAAAALFPMASVVLSWVRYRRVEFIGIAVLVTILTGVTVALVTDDVRFAVLKAAPAFGLFGLACLASLSRNRPLMFFVSRHYNAGGDEAKAAAWTARLENAGFRRSMRLLTVVWGTACVVEAMLGIAAAFLLPPGTALVAEPVLGIGSIAGLLAWTTAYARRRARASEAQ